VADQVSQAGGNRPIASSAGVDFAGSLALQAAKLMSLRRACVLALAVTCHPGVVFAAPAEPPPRNGVGAAATYLAPSSPLEAGAGVEVQYRHQLARLILTADLGLVQLDREVQGVAREGNVTLTRIAGGVLWPFVQDDWMLAAGGGIDWFEPDGDGDYRSDPQTGVTNDYDVDAGFGIHVDFEASRAIGKRWRLVGRAGWLEAELDGTHRFIVSGVPGAPLDVTFDLRGPQLQVGAVWMF